MTIEVRVINKLQNKQGLILVRTNASEELWIHPNLVNDEGWETIKFKPTSKERKQVKKQLRNLKRLAQQEKKAKEIRRQTKVAKASTSEEPSKSIKSHFTLADFIVPISKDEDELVISICNKISWARYPLESEDEDNYSSTSWDDLLDDLLGDDLFDDDKYLSDEIWDEDEVNEDP